MSHFQDSACYLCTAKCGAPTNYFENNSMVGELLAQSNEHAVSNVSECRAFLGVASGRHNRGKDLRFIIERLLRHNKNDIEEISIFLSRLGIDASMACKCQVLDHLFHRLKAPGREIDLVMFFCFRVYKDLTHGLQGTSAVQDSSDPLIRILAKQLTYDVAVVDSIRKYKIFDLIRFGYWIEAPGVVRAGGSRHTVAYRRAQAEFSQFARFEIKRFTWKRIKRASNEIALLVRRTLAQRRIALKE
jgi:hypothetical protein